MIIIKVLDAWKASGREIFELVEPVDSLHPTQVTSGSRMNTRGIGYTSGTSG